MLTKPPPASCSSRSVFRAYSGSGGFSLFVLAASKQGSFKVYLWLNHDTQVIDLDDSQFQDTEDHVEGDDKSHWERLSHAEGHPTAWQHGKLKGKQPGEFVGNSGEKR